MLSYVLFSSGLLALTWLPVYSHVKPGRTAATGLRMRLESLASLALDRTSASRYNHCTEYS